MNTGILRELTWNEKAHVLALSPRNMPVEKPAADCVLPADLAPTVEDSRSQGVVEGRQLQMNEWQARLAELEEQVRQDGFDQGYADGLRQAEEASAKRLEEELQIAQAQWQEAAARLANCVADLTAARSQCMHDAEDDLVALCHEVVSQILADAAPRRDTIVGIVRAAQCAMGEEAVEVHLHPRDIEAIKHAGLADQAWRWVADERVKGGAVLSTRGAMLDARLESQLKAFSGALLAHRELRRKGMP